MSTSWRPVLRSAMTGAALGAVWGALARAWMRMVSTDPEFSWSGTLGIVGFAAVFGALVGIASAARRQRGWRRALRWAVLPGLVLFAGPGLPLLPAFVVAGPLAGRRHGLAKAVAAVAVVGPGVVFWWTERLDEVHMLSAPLHVRLGYLVGMPVVSAALTLAGHLVWGPLRTSGQAPTSGSGGSGSVGGVAGPRPQEAAQRLQA